MDVRIHVNIVFQCFPFLPFVESKKDTVHLEKASTLTVEYMCVAIFRRRRSTQAAEIFLARATLKGCTSTEVCKGRRAVWAPARHDSIEHLGFDSKDSVLETGGAQAFSLRLFTHVTLAFSLQVRDCSVHFRHDPSWKALCYFVA